MRGTWCVVLVALLLPVGAGAQVQCEGQLIQYGATTQQVLDLCGEPARRVRTERVINTGLVDSPASEELRIPVEEWTYEPPGQFTRTLIFESGRLQKIVSGGYPDLDGGF